MPGRRELCRVSGGVPGCGGTACNCPRVPGLLLRTGSVGAAVALGDGRAAGETPAGGLDQMRRARVTLWPG